MERDSFPHDTVVQRARRSFVPVKLRSDIHEQLALSFNLSGLPATVVVAPTREVVAIHQGYLGPQELDSLLREALARRPGREAMEPSAGKEPKPKLEPQLALSGYCPVSLISNRRLVPGQTEYTVQHEGRVYLFADLVMSNLFRRDPERYIPLNNGRCPVNQVDRGQARPGDPRCGVLYQGHLYLCATAEDRRRFLKDPERYASADVAERGFCPHCLQGSGRLVKGDPRYSIRREGRRYLFPDTSHRDAFLTSADPKTARR
jgi:YHS domain-containing protein